MLLIDGFSNIPCYFESPAAVTYFTEFRAAVASLAVLGSSRLAHRVYIVGWVNNVCFACMVENIMSNSVSIHIPRYAIY